MTKLTKVLALVLVAAMLCIALASCGKISESYAKKINKAAEKDEHYTYTEVMEDLGDNAVDITLLKSGVIIAVKGCETLDEIIGFNKDVQAVDLVETETGSKKLHVLPYYMHLFFYFLFHK